MMRKYWRQGTSAEIDRLFLANSIVDCLSYPILLIYMTANNFFFPMSDYVGGIFGCLLIIHFLDAFVRYYSYYFPLAVALLRCVVFA
jgi:hypothetical protein